MPLPPLNRNSEHKWQPQPGNDNLIHTEPHCVQKIEHNENQVHYHCPLKVNKPKQVYNMEWREKLLIWEKETQNIRMDEKKNLVRGTKDY